MDDQRIEQIRCVENQSKSVHRQIIALAYAIGESQGDLEQQVTELHDLVAFKRDLEQQQRTLIDGANDPIPVWYDEDAKARIAAKLAKDAEIKAAKHAALAATEEAFHETKRLQMAEAQRLKTEREASELATLAAQEKRTKIIHQALSTGSLLEVAESREQRIVNDQTRSGGGVVRIESGDGK